MTARPYSQAHRFLTLLPALLLTVGLATPGAQTKITPDKNKYTPAEDVKIGREASAEVRKQLPMLSDGATDNYVEEIGQRLVRAIPQEFRHDEFRYSFDVVNQKEINAFALPGGPMFLHRGMIEAAKNEGEVAGVMAHEIAHVALRHGTAQATKAQKFQIGAIAGQILGAIVGGTAGSVIAQGSNFGLGAYFLKYGREYERQADILGAQIMARAGYDPRRMADMFRTIEQQGRNAGPEWLSSHPNPGNRYEAIHREAALLRIEGDAPSNAQFNEVKSRLARMQPAFTAEQVARGQARNRRTSDDDAVPAGRRTARIEPPANSYRSHPVGNFMQLSVPANWDRIEGQNTVTFAPEGGVFRGQSGQTVFTHGVEVGVIANESHNLRQGTEELLESFAQANPRLRLQGNYQRTTVSGRPGLTALLRNESDATGETEMIVLTTVQLRDGSLLYFVNVAPEDEYNTYQRVFNRVRQTVRLQEPARSLR